MGHTVDVAASAEEGIHLAAGAAPDLLILDVRLPGMDGLTAMESFARHLKGAPIIVITAFGDLKTAVEAVRNGAFEYVVKPFDLAEIRGVIERGLRVLPSEKKLAASEALDGMLGQSPAMQNVFKKIALAANSDAAVLLHGESGVGKELAATAIHRHSARRQGPFVSVNIASLSPSLAEAELFGHTESAVAGTTQSRSGILLQANDGTLFLDEVAAIPPTLQLKLLRVLDHGDVLPVGSDMPLQTRFRVISATTENLRAKVEAGEFRHDLYFRLCTFAFDLPPLRERPEDIALLARQFALQFGSDSAALAEETITELQGRPWFGNVRELRNAIEHAIVLARRGLVIPEHLPPALPNLWRSGGVALPMEEEELVDALSRIARDLAANPELAGTVYDRFLQQVEPPLLSAVMDACGKRFAPAARVLGLHRTTLKKKLTQYELEDTAAES